MKKMYTTAMGRQIDFEGLKSLGEETIAVGNMKVNARGDNLGPGGAVQQSRNASISDHYHAAAGETREEKIQRQRMAGASVGSTRSRKSTNQNREVEMSQQDDVQNNPAADEPPTPREPFVAPDKKLRGTLADSMAKEASVVQEKMSDPRRLKGPSRI